MLKKITLAVVCFCCLFLFSGCYANDRFDSPNSEEDYFYEVFWYFQGEGAGASAPDECYLSGGRTIYQYSVAAQELTALYQFEEEDDYINDYAINDNYIFL